MYRNCIRCFGVGVERDCCHGGEQMHKVCTLGLMEEKREREGHHIKRQEEHIKYKEEEWKRVIDDILLES